MAPQLDGRVFSRLQQFAALHGDFQEEVKELEVFLTANKTGIFGLHHANLVKTIRSIRAKPLVEKIDAWLQNKNAPVVAAEPESVPVPAPATTEQVTPATEEVTPTPTEEVTPTPPTETPAATTETVELPAETPEELAAKAAATAEATAARLAHAKKLLEALVLRGFVTPYKEQEKLPNFAAPVATETTSEATDATETKPIAPLVFKDSELLVPVASEVADDPKAVTVWQLVDGAVFAGVLKRKAGFMAPFTQGKDVYAVINQRLQSLTLFETDVGRHPIVHFAVGDEETSAKVNVAFDKSQFPMGIKVWNDVTTELLSAGTKLEREKIVHALVSVGLQYREDATLNVETIKSIYELKDVGIDGEEITFDKYQGKVLLIVNVSSKCGLTPTNYPELVTLDEKYRDMGLVVLGFPCNQFWGQEPGTHEEILEFVKTYNVQFPLFAKGDVNGTETRAVYAYLKAKQSGLGGDYIKWNFGKFLVDRNGQPVARYGPMEKPLSFESEIVKLLSEEAKPVTVEETKTTAETTEAAAVAATETEAVVEAHEVTETPVLATETVETEAVPPPARVGAVEEKAAVLTEKAPETTTKTESTVVKTLSVEKLPLPVEETKPAAPEPTPETKTEVELKPAAAAAGEDFAPTTTTSKTEELLTETPQVVQGFTPGNAPAP